MAFINTGFLDRTGDEMHTAMHAGPMIRKGDMKTSAWIQAYEKNNVLVGLACGLRGRAQIGKGMWAMPDLMAAMLEQKIAHPKAGANTAWVPSPDRRDAARAALPPGRRVRTCSRKWRRPTPTPSATRCCDGLLHGPGGRRSRTGARRERQQELDNNAQGILGYVVRWIDQGVGCSKVPDIHNVGLMEDRATLRISSQHIANWLLHGVVTRAAGARDLPAHGRRGGQAERGRPVLQADGRQLRTRRSRTGRRCDLVFKGMEQPSGYTEPLLHAWRLKVKAAR